MKANNSLPAVCAYRARRLPLLLLGCLVFCLLFLSGQALATSYYLDSTGGNDTNDGSLAHPWKSVRKANETGFSPGDTLFLKRGETWNATLRISSSGDRQWPFTIGAYGDGPLPLIDATAPVSGSWLVMGNNIYAHPWPHQPYVLFYNNQPQSPIFAITLPANAPRIPEPGAILLQVQKGTPYTNFLVLSTDIATKTLYGFTNKYKHWDTVRPIQVRQINPRSGQEEIWSLMPPPADVRPKLGGLTENGRWFWQDNTLYLASDIPPDQAGIRVGSLDYGIDTNKQNRIAIRDIQVKGANIAGILLDTSRQSLVERTTVFGIGNKSHRAGIMLLDSSDNLLRENTIDGVLGNGMVLYGFAGVTRNNDITDNTITKSGASGILVGGEEPFRVSDNRIAGNTVLASNQNSYDSAGIYVYFCGGGNVIRHNTIKNGGTPFLKSSGIMLDTDSGPVTVSDNEIENNSFAGISVTESGHKILRNHLSHNYNAHWDNAEIIFFPVNDNVRNCEVRGNRIESDHAFFRIEPGSGRGHTIDANTYSGGNAKPFYWQTAWLTFKQWQEITGYDLHSGYQSGE